MCAFTRTPASSRLGFVAIVVALTSEAAAAAPSKASANAFTVGNRRSLSFASARLSTDATAGGNWTVGIDERPRLLMNDLIDEARHAVALESGLARQHLVDDQRQ